MESYKLKFEYRNLFLNKYEYKASARLVGIGFCRNVFNIEKYKNTIERIRSWWTSPMHELDSTDRKFRSDYVNYLDRIDFEHISIFLKWRSNYKGNCSYRQNSDKVTMFTNDIDSLNELVAILPEVQVTRAISAEPNTIYFKKEPKFKHRIYLKPKKLTDEFYNSMHEFLKKNKSKSIYKFSPALARCFKPIARTYFSPNFLHGSYYIDYDDPSTEVYLHIMFPGMMGKTYNCKKQP
jgi:hypothetical protein